MASIWESRQREISPPSTCTRLVASAHNTTYCCSRGTKGIPTRIAGKVSSRLGKVLSLYVTVTVTAVTSGRCRGLGTKRSHREQAAKIVQWAVSCRLASGNDRTRYVCSDKSSPGLRSTRQRLALAHTYNSKELYSIKIPHTCLVQYAHVSIRQHSCYEHGNTRFTYVRLSLIHI